MTIPEIENGVQTTNTLSNNLGAKITKFGIGGIYDAMTIIYLWFGGMNSLATKQTVYMVLLVIALCFRGCIASSAFKDSQIFWVCLKFQLAC